MHNELATGTLRLKTSRRLIMEEKKLIQKINEFLTDQNVLLLESMQSNSNLFETLAVSHIELWHTAFIKWVLDPKSNLNLNSYPLKRFLYTVIYHGNVSEEFSQNIYIVIIYWKMVICCLKITMDKITLQN